MESDIPNSKFPWKELKRTKDNPIKTKEFVLQVGLIDSLLTEAGAQLLGDESLADTWQTMPVLIIFLMDCGDGKCYIRGDLGEIGGNEAVTLEEGEDFLTLKIEAIAAFAKAMGIEVEEREDTE